MQLTKQTYYVDGPASEKATLEAIAKQLSSECFSKLIRQEHPGLTVEVSIRLHPKESEYVDKIFSATVDGELYTLKAFSEQWAKETVKAYEHHKKWYDFTEGFEDFVVSRWNPHRTYVTVTSLTTLDE